MLENIRRLREPAAWVVLAVTAAGLVLALVRFVLELSTGSADFSAAAQDVALRAMNLTLVVVVVGLVWSCVFVQPPTPGAPRLATAAALVVTLGTLLTMAGTLLGLSASAGVLGVVLEFLGGLLDIILKSVAAMTLWLIHRGLRGGRIQPAAVEPAGPPATLQAPAPPGPAQAPPSWAPETAAGSVWLSAADAAQGAPASGTGVPGGGGWHPVRRPGTGSPSVPDAPRDPSSQPPGEAGVDERPGG